MVGVQSHVGGGSGGVVGRGATSGEWLHAPGVRSTAVRRLAAALMWSRGKVMVKEDDLGERIPWGIVEQTVEIAWSPGDTTSADVTAVVKSASEARPCGTAKHSASAKSELAVSSGEAGSPWPGEEDTTDADFTEAAKSAAGARPHGIVKHSAPTASELAVSTDAAGSARPGKQNTTVDAATAVEKSAGESLPPGMADFLGISFRTCTGEGLPRSSARWTPYLPSFRG